MSDMWDSATLDYEGETRERQYIAAKVAAASHWGYLAGAESKPEFDQRKALIAERLDHIVERSGASGADFAVVRDRLEASLDEDFDVVHRARLAKRTGALLQRVAAKHGAGTKAPLQCQECGNKFSRSVGPGSSPKCPKCKSYDVDADYSHPNSGVFFNSSKTAAGGDIIGDLASMPSGQMNEYSLPDGDKKYRVSFWSRQAIGDNGSPVPGDEVGEFTLYGPDGRSSEFHVGPGPYAKRYMAEQVAKRIHDGLNPILGSKITADQHSPLTTGSEGQYRVDVRGTGESTWSTNALTFDTPEEAADYASDLSGRWMGMDMARVVENTVPKHEQVDTSDPRIVVNWSPGGGGRVGSKTADVTSPGGYNKSRLDEPEDAGSLRDHVEDAHDLRTNETEDHELKGIHRGDHEQEEEHQFGLDHYHPRVGVRHTAPGGGEHGGYHIEGNGPWKVVNHIGETKSSFDSHDKALAYQRALMVNVPGAQESAERHEEAGTSEGKSASLIKGAPFGGYEDFDACVSANSDKDDPSAYCGKIKHETEDKKEGAKVEPFELSWRDAEAARIEIAAIRRMAEEGRSYHNRQCRSCGNQVRVQLGQDFPRDHKAGCPEQADFPGRDKQSSRTAAQDPTQPSDDWADSRAGYQQDWAQKFRDKGWEPSEDVYNQAKTARAVAADWQAGTGPLHRLATRGEIHPAIAHELERLWYMASTPEDQADLTFLSHFTVANRGLAREGKKTAVRVLAEGDLSAPVSPMMSGEGGGGMGGPTGGPTDVSALPDQAPGDVGMSSLPQTTKPAQVPGGQQQPQGPMQDPAGASEGPTPGQPAGPNYVQDSSGGGGGQGGDPSGASNSPSDATPVSSTGSITIQANGHTWTAPVMTRNLGNVSLGDFTWSPVIKTAEGGPPQPEGFDNPGAETDAESSDAGASQNHPCRDCGAPVTDHQDEGGNHMDPRDWHEQSAALSQGGSADPYTMQSATAAKADESGDNPLFPHNQKPESSEEDEEYGANPTYARRASS